MDFIKKKAFEAQLNKVGKDLGLGSNLTSGFGAASSRAEPRQSEFSIFPSRGNNHDVEGQRETRDASPLSAEVATIFDSKPNNFPIFLHFFYVDRSILSDAARKPVNNAFHLFCIIEALLLLNVIWNIVFTVLNKGNTWIDLLVGSLIAVLLSIYQLIAYETAFRGAYRTSTNLRKRYMYFTVANIVLIGLYAFMGVSFFNGWANIVRIPDDAKSRNLQKGLTIVEAFLWTGTMFFVNYTLFDFYHFVQGRAQGLSDQSLNSASTANTSEGQGDYIPAETGTTRPGRTTRTNNAQIQAIRDRYGTPDM